MAVNFAYIPATNTGLTVMAKPCWWCGDPNPDLEQHLEENKARHEQAEREYYAAYERYLDGDHYGA